MIPNFCFMQKKHGNNLKPMYNSCVIRYKSICQLADAGQAILTNVEKAYACYTSDIKQTQRFSAEFVDALSHLLASSIAMTLTGNTELQSINLQLAQQAVDLARYQDATERERHTRYPHQYSDARFM